MATNEPQVYEGPADPSFSVAGPNTPPVPWEGKTQNEKDAEIEVEAAFDEARRREFSAAWSKQNPNAVTPPSVEPTGSATPEVPSPESDTN